MDDLTKGLIEHLRKNGSNITVKVTPQFVPVKHLHPVPQEEQMRTNERDNHFQGFAKLLWDELMNANGHGSIDVDTTFDDGIDPTNYRLLIAQRAFDFFVHTLAEFNGVSHEWVLSFLSSIPDMTEWPTMEPSPAAPTPEPPAQSDAPVSPPASDTP